MMRLLKDLWFKRRDLISDGFDESLKYISKIIPLKIQKIQSGKKCWTWKVPEKWSVKNAYIKTLGGKRLLDLEDHPLHVMSYSLPINKIVSKKELMAHLYAKQERPNAIPYEFKFYQRDWGFCIQQNRLKNFKDNRYKVLIDSKFEKGELKVGDLTVPGKTEEIVAIVSHLDHPAMVNDDLSGVAVAVDLARKLKKKKNRYTYKFLFVPETIGSIAYLSQNEKIISKIKYGIFLEMLGNNNRHALQLSHQGDSRLDKIAKYVLRKNPEGYKEGAFRKIVRNDEMVFNGPGVNIPMISISRSAGEPNHYPEYHTSDDNLKIISEKRLKESKATVLEILKILDHDYIPKRKFKGPVFLSGYGLWVDWRLNRKMNQAAEQIMLKMEGDKSIFEIAEELNLDFWQILDYINKFLKKDLIEKNKSTP